MNETSKISDPNVLNYRSAPQPIPPKPREEWAWLAGRLFYRLALFYDFEIILPKFPTAFTHTYDPYNALAYTLGGLLAGIYWNYPFRHTIQTLYGPSKLDSALTSNADFTI